MKIYEVAYQDLNYNNVSKLFVKLDKAKEYSKNIMCNYINTFKNNSKRYELYSKEEFYKTFKDDDMRCIISKEYPVCVQHVKYFENEIQESMLLYYYLQDEEKYEMSFSIAINNTNVED